MTIDLQVFKRTKKLISIFLNKVNFSCHDSDCFPGSFHTRTVDQALLGWDLPKLSIPVIFPSSSARAGPNQKLMDCSSKLVPCFSNKMSSNFDSQIEIVRYFGQGPLKKPFN